MMRCRSFLNSDLSGIVSVWNQQPPMQGCLSPMTTDLFEQYVLAKPFFDPEGLLIAVDDQLIVGFAHAAFAIGEHRGDRDVASGILCMLMTLPRDSLNVVRQELMREAEAYLARRGATEFYAGATGERAPYYLGLYGGSKLPGVLASDQRMIEALRQSNYVEERRTIIFQRDVHGFRPPVERQCIPLRRIFRLGVQPPRPPSQWFEACSYCWVERTTFTLDRASGEQGLAIATFWDMEPMASGWGRRAMGLLETKWEGVERSEDLLVFFLGETMRQFATEGIATVEVQAAESDPMLVAACRRLGFQEVDRGIQFHKR